MGLETEMRRVRGFGDTTFVMLAREGADGHAGQAPLPEVTLRFTSQGDPESEWRVRSFTATEGLSAVYECVIDLAHASFAANPDALLGHPAVLHVERGSLTRRFAGVVRRVEHRGTSATHRLARVFVVPSLWALSQRSDTRIFQDKSAVEVVEAVLREAGLYAGMLDVQVQRALPAREYCVQHRESDLAFVSRLLEEEGVAYHFRHDDEGETLVLSDGSHAWKDVPTMDGAAIPVAGPEVATQSVESVRHLAWERSLRPTAVTVRDFDFTRPELRVERSAPRRRDATRAKYEPGPEVTLGGYQGTAYTTDDAQEQSTLRHEAEQADGAVGAGEGAVTGMFAGGMFQLAVAGAHVPAQRYVVTQVEHEGVAPEELLQGTHDDRPTVDRYRNRFRCAPVEVPWRPARVTPRPVIAGLQTAIVVGPPGEEIYTDPHGRIRVQFHWDRLGNRDAHSACWMRVIQGPWAGGGWGFQFIPRVGMEVAVAFLDGDPDRPVVTGTLYNGRNRPPYPLPDERTRSGIRTNSSPGGNGYNELRFEDLAGGEEIHLHAQRDMRERVLHDHSTTVDRNQTNTVGGDHTETVRGAQSLTVHRDRTHHVIQNENVTIDGNRTTHVGVNDTHAAARSQLIGVGFPPHTIVAYLRDGDQVSMIRNDRAAEVGHDDTVVVGNQHVIERDGGTERVVIAPDGITANAAQRIRLQCGANTWIELTPDRISLHAPEVVAEGTSGTSVLTLGRTALLESPTLVRLHSAAGGSVDCGASVNTVGDEVHIRNTSGAHVDWVGPQVMINT